jgi:hypothetical protein
MAQKQVMRWHPSARALLAAGVAVAAAGAAAVAAPANAVIVSADRAPTRISRALHALAAPA